MTQKKQPLRKCTGCGEMKEKRELIRVVKAPDTKDENSNFYQIDCNLYNCINSNEINGKKRNWTDATVRTRNINNDSRPGINSNDRNRNTHIKWNNTKDENGNLTAKGEISLDLTGKKSGRGAYICHDIKCFEKARKARRFERAFSCKIPDEVYEQLKNSLKADS